MITIIAGENKNTSNYKIFKEIFIMMLFSRSQVLRRQGMYVPRNMRAALGYHEGIDIHLVSIDNTSEDGIPCELLATSAHWSSWSDLWRLRATFYDRPGIITELASILTEQNIDVFSCRSSTAEQSEYLNVEFLINTGLYTSKVDKSSKYAELATEFTFIELKALISAHFIEELLFLGHKPLFSIHRNLPLYRARQRIVTRESTVINDKRIKIPDSMITQIRKNFQSKYSSINNLSGDRKNPLVFLVADTENSLLRITVLFRDTGHIHVRVKAKDKVGTLATITSQLRDAHINICQMYTRTTNHGEYNLTDLLLHYPEQYDHIKKDKALRHFVRGVFHRSAVKNLICDISFPRPLKKDEMV